MLEKRNSVLPLIKIEKKELEMNGIIIESRSDGLINATAICKAFKKKFSNWHRLESTKELIQILEGENSEENADAQIRASGNYKIIEIKKGGNDKKSQGVWIHPDLAVQLAQWISPVFALKVSKWVRELVVTGSVLLGDEKSEQQILELQNTLQNERKQHKLLQTKHKKLLKHRQYHKLKKGPVFYIFQYGENFKVGWDFQQLVTNLQKSILNEIKN